MEMDKLQIVVLDRDTLGDDIDLDVFLPLGEVKVYGLTSPDQVVERISDADVVVINKIKMNESNLSQAKKVKLICLSATGYDNVDTAYCREHGIGVCNVVGYSTQSVAQITVAMALSLCSKLAEYRDFVMSGQYSRQSNMNRLEPIYHEIAGKTWGIVGFGNIGRQVARVAEALGCRVIVNKRTAVDEYPCVDIDTICREADILSVHTPLSAETRGLISAERIAMMKEDAILINVARGAVIDEAAAARAILDGRLGGLGVDVYSTEPFPVEHPYSELFGCENVCLTPHMAWGAHEARVRCIDEIAKNIRAFFAGEIRCRVEVSD